MEIFFDFFFDIISSLFGTINSIQISAFGLSVGFYDIALGFIALTMVISIFWKGVKG